MLHSSFKDAAAFLENTKSPGEDAAKGFETFKEYIDSAPEDEKLARFQEIVDAHKNAWKATIGNFAKLHTKTIAAIMETAPELLYMQDDLDEGLQGVQKAESAIRSGSLTKGYNIAGINVWSPKKQEVSQLFALVSSVPEQQQQQALDFLSQAARQVAPAMSVVAKFENDLLNLASPYQTKNEDFRKRVVNLLQANAAYHKDVGDDWHKLAQAVELSAQAPSHSP